MNVAHGGGFYQDDIDWVKSLNGKGILTTGQVRGGTIVSEGRLGDAGVFGTGKGVGRGDSLRPKWIVEPR